MATDLSLLGEVFVISSLFLLAIGYYVSGREHVFLGRRFPTKIGNQFSILGWIFIVFFRSIQVEYYILNKDYHLVCDAAADILKYEFN